MFKVAAHKLTSSNLKCIQLCDKNTFNLNTVNVNDVNYDSHIKLLLVISHLSALD